MYLANSNIMPAATMTKNIGVIHLMLSEFFITGLLAISNHFLFDFSGIHMANEILTIK